MSEAPDQQAGGGKDADAGVVRELADAALLVFISDTHMGGDEGIDLFEAHDELTALFDELSSIPDPVEFILAGDVFDLLRIGTAPPGENRLSVTLARPEYAGLVSAWQAFATRPGNRVTYLPGNHDAEVWWNADLRRTLQETGLVTEFALSYAARYRSFPDRVIYSEHGNQFDAANARRDYADRIETPLGDHVVAELIRPIAGRLARADEATLRDLPRIHPLTLIPEWLVGRLFYRYLSSALRFVALPLLVGYLALLVGIAAVARLSGEPPDTSGIESLVAVIAYSVVLLAVVYVIVFVAAGRAARRAVASIAPDVGALDEERASFQRVMRLKDSEALVPLHPTLRFVDLDVFVWGHSHAASLTVVERSGPSGIGANPGSWLRQLRPVRAHLRAPAVFVSRFVLGHVRVRTVGGHIRVELWEQRRAASDGRRVIESLAIAGRASDATTDDRPRLTAVAELATRRSVLDRGEDRPSRPST